MKTLFKNLGVLATIERMRNLRIKNRLIKVLHREFILKGDFPTRNQFVNYFVKNERGKLTYRSDTLREYHLRIDRLLGQCIAPPIPSSATTPP